MTNLRNYRTYSFLQNGLYQMLQLPPASLQAWQLIGES